MPQRNGGHASRMTVERPACRAVAQRPDAGDAIRAAADERLRIRPGDKARHRAVMPDPLLLRRAGRGVPKRDAPVRVAADNHFAAARKQQRGHAGRGGRQRNLHRSGMPIPQKDLPAFVAAGG